VLILLKHDNVSGSQRYVMQYLDPGTNEDPARDGEFEPHRPSS